MKKLILILSVSILCGCASNSTNSKVDNIGDMGNITIVPKSVRSQRVNDFLVAQATFHNGGSSNINGFYRCKFFDANMMKVGKDQTWIPISIYKNGNQDVSCRAMNKEATDFKFEFSINGNNVNNF